MEIFKSRITKIEFIERTSYKVSLQVNNNTEIEDILHFEDENRNFLLHVFNYEFIIDHYKMEPIGEAVECMKIYHSYEDWENLNPKFRRQ